MTREVAQGLSAAGFTAIAAGLAWWLGVGLRTPIVWAGARAALQLAAVGAFVALVFRVPALAAVFVAVMLLTAALTSGQRLRGVPRARGVALVSIAVPALSAAGLLLAIGAFAATPRAALPSAGILIGGAMAATTLAGRRFAEALRDGADEIEARLCLGDRAREATAALRQTAMRTGVVPVLDQTRSAGLVTLPGTFVGLLLGGASPTQAALTQLVVLTALLAVELASTALVTELILRGALRPGERVVAPPVPA